MKSNTHCLVKITLLIAATLLAVPALAWDHPPNQVTIEAGVSFPYGQLGADFERTRLGLGATEGLEIGFSYHMNLSETVTIAPTFLFLDYGNYKGFNEEVDEFFIQSSSYRYLVEFRVTRPGSFKTPRLFLGVGAGLFRNRVTGFYQDYVKAVDKSVNTFGVSLRAGVQIIGLEFSVVYNINRFNTWLLFESDYRERYNWDTINLRAGWLIPFGD